MQDLLLKKEFFPPYENPTAQSTIGKMCEIQQTHGKHYTAREKKTIAHKSSNSFDSHGSIFCDQDEAPCILLSSLGLCISVCFVFHLVSSVVHERGKKRFFQ